MSLLQINQESDILFDDKNLVKELDNIISFFLEISESPFASISFLNNEKQIIKNNSGIDFEIISENIAPWNSIVIESQQIFIISDISKDSKSLSILNDITQFPVQFYAGFPIFHKSNIIAVLSIADFIPKSLTNIQLKILKHITNQIKVIVDLHAQKNDLQKNVQEKEKIFESFIENSNEIVYELDIDGIITYASKNWVKLLGYEVVEIIGRSNTTLLHPDDLQHFIIYLNQIIEKGTRTKELIYRVLHKEGRYVWHCSNIKISEKNGKPIFIGNSRDITEYIVSKQNLEKQKDFYEKILERIPTDLAVFDENHKYIYINPLAIKNEDRRKFIIGKDDFQYADYTGRTYDFAENRRAKFLESLKKKSLIEWEDEIKHLDGTSNIVNRKFNPVFKDDGTFEMMVGFGVDITEIKKFQQEIQKNRQLINSIIKNVAVGILVQGPKSEILENNKAACEMLGLSEDQLLGKTSFDEHWKVIHLDGTSFKSEDHPVPQAIQKLKPINNVVMGVHRPTKNDLVWLLVDAIPIFDDKRELLYVICSFNDITAQKNAEAALKISNERFAYSIKATFDAIWDWDLKTDKIFVGEGFTSLFGYRFENNYMHADACANFVHPEDRKATFDSFDHAIENQNKTWSYEYRYLKEDGNYAYVSDNAIIIRDDKGEAIRVIGAMKDITTEKELTDKLRQSEQRFRRAFKYSGSGIALVNIKGYYTEVNQRFCEMLGYSNEELKSLTFQEITHLKDLKEDLEFKAKLDSGEISNFSSEKRFICKNKSIIWVFMTVSLVQNINAYYIVQLIDITDRKKIERQNKLLIAENNRNKTIQLQEATNRYRFLADNAADLVCTHDLNSIFQYVSPSAKKILGYDPKELLGNTHLSYVHPDELKYLHKSLKDFIDKKVDHSITARFKAKNGEYIWLETIANLIEKEGVIVGFQTSSRDITARKKAEIALENALNQERVLNELRTNFVSTVSHEFRTPMTTIRASAELISKYLDKQNIKNTPLLLKRASIITEEIDCIVELMDAVLTISREDSGKTNFNPKVFDLKQLCINIIENHHDNFKNKQKIKLYLEKDNCMMMADVKLMEYSILNILNNAIKYSDNKKDVHISLKKLDQTILLEIIDFGIGIPEEEQSKLFNTFFRASNSIGYPGTGLGLHIVKTFTERNFGTIKLESTLGTGTKVTFKFPVIKNNTTTN